MSTKFDIKIKEKEYKEFNKLFIEFSGNDVNHVLVNTLRRTIIQHIPTYAFDNINIIKNTSVFNNDCLKMRLSNFPIPNIENNTTNMYQQIINDDLDSDKISQFQVYLEMKNTELNIKNVTTDDAEYFNKEKKIKNIYKKNENNKPLLIVNLKHNEEIKLSIFSSLNIGKVHIKYSPVSYCVFEEVNKNTYLFKLESNGQIEEYDIIKRSCDILIIKLNIIKNQLKDINIENTFNGELEFKNEDHTIGNLICDKLQNHKNIAYAGYKLDHLLVENIIIKYTTNEIEDIVTILNFIIINLINTLNYIKTILK